MVLTRCAAIDHVSRLNLLALLCSFDAIGLVLLGSKCVGFILETEELNSLSLEVNLCMFSLPAVKGGSQFTISFMNS